MKGHNRRSVIQLLATTAIAAIGSAASGALTTAVWKRPGKARRPNVVIYIPEDLNQDDLGVYGGDADTPHIDQMAREGLLFERAFNTSPTCSVSRSSILTGDYPMHHGGHALGSVIKDGIATLPQILKAQGYRVVIAGKTHFGPPRNFPFEYLHDSVTLPPGKKNVLFSEVHMPAVERMLETHDQSQPLALIVASFAAHVRWPENRGYDAAKLTIRPDMLDTPDLRDVRTRYLTKVSLADTELGELRAMLKKHDMVDNTLLMMTTDHGAQFPLAKWNLYDAGTKVPLIAVWPGRIAPGTRTSAMVSHVDLLPTIQEAVGGPPLQGIDGRSMMLVLEGKASDFRDEIFTAHSGDLNPRPEQNVAPMRAIRTGSHKLIVNFYPGILFKDAISVNTHFVENHYWLTWKKLAETDPKAAKIVDKFEHRPPVELYDMDKDPYEMNNLAKDPAYSQTVSSMRERLYAWMRSQGEDPNHVAMPTDAPHGPIPYTAAGD